MVRSVLWRGGAAVALILAACSRPAASIDIGPTGGSVALADEKGPRVALKVPVDALPTPLPFQLRALPVAPAGAVGPAIEATPHGAIFAKPVALQFSPKSSELAAGISFGELRVATLTNGTWELLPTSFPAPGVVEGLTTHFSTFALVAPCHVSGIGTDFPLTACPTFTPRVQTSTTANLEAQAGPVTLTIRIRPTTGAGTGTLSISGLRAGWTYYLARDGSGQLTSHTANAVGVVSFSQDLASAHRLVLMAQHGSFTLTAATCPQVGTWNPTTRTCTLTNDIKEPPVWVEEDNLTLDCAGRTVGGFARQSLGVYVDSRTTVGIRNCTITNVDTGVQGAVDGLQVSNVIVRNAASDAYGSAGFNLGEATNIVITGTTVARFSQGISFSGGGAQVSDTTLRGTQVAVHVEGATGALLDGLHLDAADVPPETNVPGAILIQVGDATVRNLTTTGAMNVYGSVVAAMFDSSVTLDGAQISRARVGARLDGPRASVVVNNTFSISEVSLQLNGGVNHVFHNNFIGNHSHSVVAATAVELSDMRPASATFQQGNFWGRACPGPLFLADDAINATDSFPYGVASSWVAGGSPGCAATPPLSPPVLTAPTTGALVNTAKPDFAGSAAPNGTVEVVEFGIVVASGTADATGAFSVVPAVGLAEGAHVVAARVTSLGQTSALSSPLAFSIDTIAPGAPSIALPAAGASVFESAPLVFGTAEPGARVDLLLDGVVRGFGNAEVSGAFSVRLVAVSAGTHVLVARAMDAAGNASIPSANRTFTAVLPGGALTGTAGRLRLDSFADFPDAFEANGSESNVVNVSGGFTRPNGAGGPNAQYVLLITRDVATTGGAVVRSLSTQAPLPNAPTFAASIGWDGRNASGQLVAAGVYASTVRLAAVRTSGGNNNGCLAVIAQGCVVDTFDFSTTAEVASAALLARPPVVPPAASVAVQAAALLPADGRVIVLPEAAFNAALAAGSAAPAGTAARQKAVALAGNATDPRFMGMVSELQVSVTPTSFSGDTFIVARAAGTSAGGRYVETNDFFVASVALSGKSSWVGTMPSYGARNVGAAPSSNCCDPQRVCASQGPISGPCGPGSLCVPPDSKAVQGPPVAGSAGVELTMYGAPPPNTSPAALPTLDYTCTGSLFPGCTQATPYCNPNTGGVQPPGQGGNGNTGSGQCVAGLLGRDVPAICTIVLTDPAVPSVCGGYCQSCGAASSQWWSLNGIHPGCALMTPGPGSTLCSPRTEADRQLESVQAQLAVEVSGCARSVGVPGDGCCGTNCFCEKPAPSGSSTPSLAPRPQMLSCTRCNGNECQKFSQPTSGVNLVGDCTAAQETCAAVKPKPPQPKPKPPPPPADPPPASAPPEAQHPPQPSPPGPAPAQPPVTQGPGASPAPPASPPAPTTPPASAPSQPPANPPRPPTAPRAREFITDREVTQRPESRAQTPLSAAPSGPSNAPGDPILVGDGSLDIQQTDFSLPGIARPLEFRRAYNSRSNDRTTLGSNWSHNWDVHLEVVREGTRPTWAPVYCGSTPARDMCVLLYDAQRNSQLFALDYGTGLYLPQAGSTDTVARTQTGGWGLRRSNGDVLLFDEEGYLVEDRDRFGNGFSIENEDTPLNTIFKIACRSDAPLTTTHPLWNSCAVLAGLLREGGSPEAGSLPWQVTANDLPIPGNVRPAGRALAEYGRAYLIHLIGGRDSAAVPFGARKRRPIRVVDDLGRALNFTYYRAPPLGAGFDFANTPQAELLERVTGPAGIRLTFEYAEPPQYPAALAERFLTRMSRVDTPVGPDVLAAPPRSFEFKYQWPTGPTASWPTFVPAVQQKHLAFFSTFAGCLYRDTYSCGNKTAQGKFVRAAGNPIALAAEATNDFISDVADNIIKVTHAGLVESETRYGLDPFSGTFDRALAQRYGARGAVQDLSRLPADFPGANWEEPSLPRAAFDYVSAGPSPTGGDRTDAVLPAQVKARYPFEVTVGASKPSHGGQFKPLHANGNPPSGVVCDGASTELRREELPGYAAEVPYFAMPDLGTATQLKRSVLSCEQLALAQTTNAAHNDLLSDLVPNAPTPATDDYLPIAILGERTGISANNNRICAWSRFVDRDGDTTWFGLNYRGQVLVNALEDRSAPGNFLFTESLYTADGLLKQARRPTRGAAAWATSAGHTAYSYGEVDPTLNNGWNRWLPAYWTRRANLVAVEEFPAAGSVMDIAEGAASSSTARTSRFTRLLYEPLFNQLRAVEEGSVVAGSPVVHRRSDRVFDYQELTNDTIAPLLTGLEAWGFRWLRTPTAPFDFDFPLVRQWQLQVPLLDEDLNGDLVRGYFSRATSRPAAGLPILLRQRSSTTADAVTTKVAWAAQGQPSLVTDSEGAKTFFDYYETQEASQYGSTAAAPTDLTASPVNVGLLARLRIKRFGASQPTNASLTPCPLLAGPYQYLLEPNCTNVPTDLAALGLPAETVAAIVDSQSNQLEDGWTTVGFSYSALGRPAVVWEDTSAARIVRDVDGRELQSVDALGSVTANAWDAHAFLESTRRTSSAGVPLSNTYFVRDDEGRATCTCTELTAGSCAGTCTPTSTNAGAAITQRTFTPEGDVAREVDPEGLQTLVTYDERKLPVREARTDPADGKTRVKVWEYSADGDLLHAGDGATPAAPRGQLAEELQYDGFRRPSTYTDVRGYDWQLGHSARELLTVVRRGDVKLPGADPGAAWKTRFEYDGFERLVRRTDNEYVTTELVRARSGHVVTQRQTGRGPTHATYDLSGRLLWQRDAAGTDTIFTWRPQPHESTATTVRRGPNGARLITGSIQTLNPAGLPTNVVEFGSGLRRSTALTLDGDGQVLETLNPEAVRVRVTRNLQGWVVTQEQQRVRGNLSSWELTSLTHDRRGSVIHVSDPNALGTSVFYNAFGDVRRREVPNLAAVVRTFDELGRLASESKAAGTVTHLYDARGDNWKDELAGATPVPLLQRSFDSLGRLQSATHFNSGLTSVAAASRAVVSQFTYDAAGRATGETRSIGSGPTHSFSGVFTLSPAGAWGRDVFSPTKAWREDFDAAGRLVAKRRYSGATLAAEGMTFEWLGELPASRAQAQGRPSPFRATVARDGYGAPTRWSYTAIDLTSPSSPVNAAEGTSYCNGPWDAAKCGDPLLRLDVVRDVLGRAASVQWQFSNPSSSTATARARPWRGYVHSATGRLEKSLEHAGVVAPISTVGLMPHAVVAADVEAAGVTAETWGYERTAAVGTLTGIRSAQSNAYRWRTLLPHTGYQLNGLELDGASRTVGHDLDGRTTQDGSRSYTLDVFGALTEVRDNGALLEAYAYDGLGRLSAVFHGGPAPTETFVYDGASLVASHSATGQRRWEAVWGPGQDVLLEWVDVAGGTGAHLPLVDHRNSVVGAWGVAAGSLSQTAVYNAEGRVALSQPDGTSACAEEGTGAVCPHPAGMPFGFGTAWRSSTTGLVSMRARWYSSQLGEFLSTDPIGYADSFNLYAYAAFDPVNRWDPFGLAGNPLDYDQAERQRYGPFAQQVVAAENAYEAEVSPAFNPERQGPDALVLGASMNVAQSVEDSLRVPHGPNVPTGGQFLLNVLGPLGALIGTATRAVELIDELEEGFTLLGEDDVEAGAKLGPAIVEVALMVHAGFVGKKTYQTYTKVHKRTRQVYTGRTSGTGSPWENVENRDVGHHMNKKGYGPAELDKSSPNRDAIRGREEMLIEAHGGAKKAGGSSGNKIRGISLKNKKRMKYLAAAATAFGRPKSTPGKPPGKRSCDPKSLGGCP